MNVDRCTRCDSAIVVRSFTREDRYLQLLREDANTVTTDTANLCSTCWDELWDWVFGEDTPNRSDTADPLPLKKLGAGVERHIDELEGILDKLEVAQ